MLNEKTDSYVTYVTDGRMSFNETDIQFPRKEMGYATTTSGFVTLWNCPAFRFVMVDGVRF